MNERLRVAYNLELSKGVKYFHLGSYDLAFLHFERAHILGQNFIITHTISHLWMLKIGWKRRNVKEIIGQLLRIGASIIFSKIWVPKGNTGGTNVNALKPMKLPEDLEKYLDTK